MYEFEEAIYENLLWNVSSLKDARGNYNQELRLKMRKESQNRRFTCPECGEPLVLNAGNIRQPYFSHYAGSDCVLTGREQGERNKQMRSAMREIAANSFPSAEIREYEPLQGAMRSQLMVYTKGPKIALNYISDFVKLTPLENKMNCMKEMGIRPIWFTPYRRDGGEKLTTAEYQICTQQPALISIDCQEGLVYIREYDTLKNKFIRENCYPLSEVRLDEKGGFLCMPKPDTCKIKPDSRPDAFGSDKLPADIFDLESPIMAWKREVSEEKKKKCDLGKKAAVHLFRLAEERGCSQSGYALEQVILRISKEEYEAVGASVYSLAHYMESRGEYWLPKKLKGNSSDRKTAAVIRDFFLEYVDEELISIPEQQDNKDFMDKFLWVLEEIRDSSSWLEAGGNPVISE